MRTTSDSNAPAIEVAREYTDSFGWHSFPLHRMLSERCSCGRHCLSPGKHPRITNWQRRDLPGEVDTNFEKFPDSNIGILTGAKSDLIVVDIDKDKGGFESFAELQKKIGNLQNETLVVDSGGGGLHLYFQHPGGKVSNSVSSVAPGIDIRGDGGYIVAPPSNHASGGTYRWQNGLYLPTSIPEALLEHLRAPSNPSRLRSHSEHIQIGSRNTTLFNMAIALNAKGISLEEADIRLITANSEFCSPPLPSEEVQMLTRSAYRYNPGNQNISYRQAWERSITAECSNLKATTRWVLTILARHMDDEGMHCFPSQETIANQAGISHRSTVRGAIKEAQEKGWLFVYPIASERHQFRRNGYVAAIPQ